MGRATRGIVLVAAVALLFAGCGGGGEGRVSAGDWATDVCQAMNEWQQSVQQRTGELTQEVPSNPQQAKDLITRMAEGTAEDAEQFRQSVEEAGVPDVENGEEAASALQNAASEAQEAAQQAAREAEDLPANDPQAFQQQLMSLVESLQSSFQAIGQRLQQAESPELQEAFQEQEACRNLQAG